MLKQGTIPRQQSAAGPGTVARSQSMPQQQQRAAIATTSANTRAPSASSSAQPVPQPRPLVVRECVSTATGTETKDPARDVYETTVTIFRLAELLFWSPMGQQASQAIAKEFQAHRGSPGSAVAQFLTKQLRQHPPQFHLFSGLQNTAYFVGTTSGPGQIGGVIRLNRWAMQAPTKNIYSWPNGSCDNSEASRAEAVVAMAHAIARYFVHFLAHGSENPPPPGSASAISTAFAGAGALAGAAANMLGPRVSPDNKAFDQLADRWRNMVIGGDLQCWSWSQEIYDCTLSYNGGGNGNGCPGAIAYILPPQKSEKDGPRWYVVHPNWVQILARNPKNLTAVCSMSNPQTKSSLENSSFDNLRYVRTRIRPDIGHHVWG